MNTVGSGARAAALLLLVGLVSCSAGAGGEPLVGEAGASPSTGSNEVESDAEGLPPAGEFGAPGAENCEPASPIVGSEALGTVVDPDDSAFADLQGDLREAVLVSDGDPYKIVVRLTGEGELAVRVTDPTGADRAPGWGPEPHGGSNYERPGDEWGIGFDFDSPGCWQVEMIRGSETMSRFWFVVS